MKNRLAPNEVRIPLAEERLKVGKDIVETGRVRIRSRVHEEEHRILETLVQEHVRVERVPTDAVVDQPPKMREESDRLIVPVFEEVVVKRYRITEEVHLIKEKSAQLHDETMVLRHNSVEVDRDGLKKGANKKK